MVNGKPRILISKIGLDGHDRGARLVAHALKDAGFDVSYLGIRHTVDEVVNRAIEYRADYLGLSFLAGDHLTMVRKVIGELRKRSADDIRLVVGGIILKEHLVELKSLGVRRVFLSGTPLAEIVDYFRRDTAKQAA